MTHSPLGPAPGRAVPRYNWGMEIETPLPDDVAALKALLVAERAARHATEQLLQAEREGR